MSKARRSWVTILAAAPCLLLSAGIARAQVPGPMETFMGFEGRLFMNGGFRLPYRFFKPIGYDPQKKYPLVLLLHGGGEKGTDNYAPISHGIGLTGPGTIFTTAENQAR